MLIPENLKSSLPALYQQDGKSDPTIYLKFFNPLGQQSWYLMEYSPEEHLAFGWVDLGLGMPELGYFSMTELESISLPYMQKIECDLYFTPTLLSKVKYQSRAVV